MAKIYFYTDERFFGKAFPVMDVDIVFTGKLLDHFIEVDRKQGFAFSPKYENNPYTNWVKRIYFDVREVEKRDSKK